MQEFIAYLVKNLVENPDEVKVKVIDGERRTLIEVSVAKQDVARVIGRKGRTIDALRTIALDLGARMGRRVRVEVID
jgi:hypothetical protein